MGTAVLPVKIVWLRVRIWEITMGNSGSKEQKILISILKHMLAERGLKLSDATTKYFYLFLITTNAVLAWRAIPPSGTEGNTLAGIQQGNDESYTSFISRLD